MKAVLPFLAVVAAVPFAASAGFETVNFTTEFLWLEDTMPESLEIGQEVDFAFNIDREAAQVVNFEMLVPDAGLFVFDVGGTWENDRVVIGNEGVDVSLDGQKFYSLEIAFDRIGETGAFLDQYAYDSFTIGFQNPGASGPSYGSVSVVDSIQLDFSSIRILPFDWGSISYGAVDSLVSYGDVSYVSVVWFDHGLSYVPEPSALSLVGLGGMVGLLILRRRA